MNTEKNTLEKTVGYFCTENGTDCTVEIHEEETQTWLDFCLNAGELNYRFTISNKHQLAMAEAFEFVAKTLSKRIPDKRSTFEKEWDKLGSKIVARASEAEKLKMEGDVEEFRNLKGHANVVDQLIQDLIVQIGLDKIGNFGIARTLQERIEANENN